MFSEHNSLLKVNPTSRRDTDGFGGLVVSMLASGTQVLRVQTRPKPLDFSDVKIFSMPSSGGEVKDSQLCGMSKNLVIYVNYGLLAKFQV